MRLGKRIKALREEHDNLTLESLCKAIGLKSSSTIQTAENKDAKGSVHAAKVANYFNVHLAWLITGEGKKYINESISSEKASYPISDSKPEASGLQELANMATPRSKSAIEKFIVAVEEKRMTDDDWEHLAAIVQRFKKPR